MALFRRTQKDSVLPEVDKYYEGERRDRAGLAWLLALVSIIVVAGIIVGLFLGGRWVYNKVTEEDQPEAPVVVENGDDLSIDGGPEGNGQAPDVSEGDNSQTEEPDQNTEQNSGDTETTAPTTTQPTSTPQTGDDATNLPSTGAGNIVGVFAGVSTVAGGAHYAVQRRKLKRS